MVKVRSLMRAVQLDPSNVGAREGPVSFYVQAPGVMGGSIAKAREQAEAIAKINPMRAHFARASIAANQKDLATAERELRAAVDENPDSLNATTRFERFLARSRSQSAKRPSN